MEYAVLIVAIAWVTDFSLAAAWMAARKDRPARYWVVLGAVLGPVALLLLRAAPPGRCQSCGTMTRGWLQVCWWCREDVRSAPRVTGAMLVRLQELRGGDATPDFEPGPPVRVEAAPAELEAVPAKVEVAPVRLEAVPAKVEVAPVRLEAVLVPSEPRPPRPARTPTPTRPVPAETEGARPMRKPAGWRRPTDLLRVITSRVAPTTPATATMSAVPAVPPAIEREAVTPAVAHERIAPSPERRVLASAVFVAGSGRLEPGRRHGLAIEGDRFLFLGPTDADPSAVVLARPASGIMLQEVGGRLIVSEPHSRSGLVLAFMSIAGRTAELQSMIAAEPPRASD